MKRIHFLIATLCILLFSCEPENIDIFIPEIRTNQAANITESEAQLKGTLTKLGSSAITALGFEVAEDAQTLANDNGERYVVATNASVAPMEFEHTLSNLSSVTEYHFRAYAITENGEAYGAILSFTTQ